MLKIQPILGFKIYGVKSLGTLRPAGSIPALGANNILDSAFEIEYLERTFAKGRKTFALRFVEKPVCHPNRLISDFSATFKVFT